MTVTRWSTPPPDPAPIAEVGDLVGLVRAAAAALGAEDVPAGLDPLRAPTDGGGDV